MALIKLSFTKIRKILLYYFLIQILFNIATSIEYYYIAKDYFNPNSLYFVTFLGNSCLIFLYLIENKRLKKETKDKRKSTKILYLDNEEGNEKKKKFTRKNKKKNSYLNKTKSFLLIICIFFLRMFDVLSEYPFFNYYIGLGNDYQIKFEFIAMMVIPFIIKNNYKVYSHQLFSFIFLILSLSLDFFLYNKGKKVFIILSLICKAIPLALSLNIIKYLNESQFINIYLLGCLDGLIYIIDIIIIEYIRKFFNFEFYLLNSFPIDNFGFIISSIFSFLKGFFYNYILFSIIQTLGPIYVSAVGLFLTILSELIFFFNIILIVSIIFALIGSLVFLEILIINCCGLGKNVKVNILSRTEQEDLELDISSDSKKSIIS